MVAQLKGGTDRNSFDLLWAWEVLSAAPIELEILETEESQTVSDDTMLRASDSRQTW